MIIINVVYTDTIKGFLPIILTVMVVLMIIVAVVMIWNIVGYEYCIY